MMSEPTGRELELHNYLLAHGAKRVDNVARTMQVEGASPGAIIVSALFESKTPRWNFWFDTFFSGDLIDDPDISIKVLAGFILRQAAGMDEAGLPLR